MVGFSSLCTAVPNVSANMMGYIIASCFKTDGKNMQINV